MHSRGNCANKKVQTNKIGWIDSPDVYFLWAWFITYHFWSHPCHRPGKWHLCAGHARLSTRAEVRYLNYVVLREKYTMTTLEPRKSNTKENYCRSCRWRDDKTWNNICVNQLWWLEITVNNLMGMDEIHSAGDLLDPVDEKTWREITSVTKNLKQLPKRTVLHHDAVTRRLNTYTPAAKSDSSQHVGC